MTELIILAIDPATSTGWACSDGTSGVEYFGVGLSDRPRHRRHGRIILRFGDWLSSMLDRTQAGVLVIEQQFRSVYGSDVALGLRGAALARAEARNLLVEEVPPSKWMVWAHRELEWWRKDDELDARAILAWWRTHREHLVTTGREAG